MQPNLAQALTALRASAQQITCTRTRNKALRSLDVVELDNRKMQAGLHNVLSILRQANMVEA